MHAYVASASLFFFFFFERIVQSIFFAPTEIWTWKKRNERKDKIVILKREQCVLLCAAGSRALRPVWVRECVNSEHI